MFSRQIIITALFYLVRVINIFILVRIILSWTNVTKHNSISQFIYSVTEPILAPSRHLIHNVLGYKGGLDFSPILSIFLIDIIYNLITRIL